jgi:hypothetical protein
VGSYENGNYSLGYVDPTDLGMKDLKQMQDFFYQANYPGNSSLWMQGAIDKRFKVGDQSLYNASYGLGNNTNGMPQKFFLNLVRRHINMICGYQRKNRKSTITIPAHDNDDSLADEYNTTMKWCDDRDGYQEYQSQAFEGACDTGMTLLHLYPDYTFDPISGDLFTDCVSYNNFLIDQYFRKQDLSDCNGIWRRRWVNKQGAKQLLPGYGKEIDKMKPGGIKDGRFPVQAELLNISMNDLFSYDEFYYRTSRKGTIVLDPKSGEAIEWEQDESDDDDMMQRTLAQQPWLITKEVQIPTVKLVITLSGKVVYHGKNLLNTDDYPFVPSMCYYEPDIQSYAWRCMGIIRNLRDPQWLYNMRKGIELQILQSQINSGWIFPVDAVTDIKAFRQTGEGFLVPLKAGHLPNEIQRIEAAAIPESLLQLSASLSEDITRISGVNEELLGAATDDKSGILSMLRQGAGLTTLQTIFDKLDYTQRLYGKIRLAAIRKNFSKGKIRNILGHDADPRFFTAHAQKYAISVEEGNYSTSQRQTELQQLLHFKELGMNIADKSILRAAFITNKKQVIAEMEEANQAEQQSQQAQAAQQEKIDNSKIMGAYAKARLDIAKVEETKARIDDLEAGAEHKRTAADLDIVRQMVELEDLDLANFRTNLEMAEIIKLTQGSKSNHPSFRQEEQTAAIG